MTEKSSETDVVVIGAGPGGYAAAFHAADSGLKTTLVDRRERPGGVCLYVGCIPSKALLHVAQLLSDAKHAKQFGIHFGDPEIDLEALRAWKGEVVDKFTGGLAQLADLRGVEFVRGRATFEDSTTLGLEDSEVSRIKFKYAIVATGSRPLGIPGIEIESDRVVNSTGALELQEVPEKLLVVGGGYIGLELGTVYASLGSKVTVVEMTGGLLPGVDLDLVRPLARRVAGLFESIRLKTKVVALEEAKECIEVTLEENGGNSLLKFDKVLISVGRKPNSDGLGLENIKVQIDGQGFVQVDDQRRTSVDNIFAIGDVAGQPMLAHKATREGKVVAEVIAGQRTIFDNVAIPAVVFTDPEVAWCGLTELEAKSQGREVKVSRFPWAASGRALTLGRGEGLTKALFDPETGRLLGVGIVGLHAGELIAEGVLAIEMAAVAEDLASTIHAHPTLSETLGEVAEAFLGKATHIYRK
jgi:dihydrolipoamide dehydrogenase